MGPLLSWAQQTWPSGLQGRRLLQTPQHPIQIGIVSGEVVSIAQMPVTLLGTQALTWTEPSVQERLGR